MLTQTERRILNIIRKNRGISRIEIVEKLKLSKPVVSVNIKRLIELGFVKEIEENHTSKKFGRKRIGLSFISDCMYIIGIDIGGTKLEAILGDLDGNIIKNTRASTRGIRKTEDLLSVVFSAVERLKSDFSNEIIGIGVGVPGTVDIKGIIKYMPAFGLKDVKLKKALEERFAIPVHIENDVTLDAYAESRIGAGQGYADIFLLSIGTGIGGGIIIDREIYRGSKGKAGEIGFMITDWSKEKNSIKEGFGPLENWFSGAFLEKKIKELSIEEAFRYLDTRKDLKSIIEKGLEHIAIAIANAIFILNPEIIILKGGIGYGQYHKIMEVIRPIIQKVIPHDILEDVHFNRGKLREFGVALGGLFYAQREILQL